MYFNFRKKINEKKEMKNLGSLCPHPVLPFYKTLHLLFQRSAVWDASVSLPEVPTATLYG